MPYTDTIELIYWDANGNPILDFPIPLPGSGPTPPPPGPPPPGPTPTPPPGPGPTAPSWPSYTGVSTFVGTSTSGRCSVWYDASLGAPGLQNAQDLLADSDRIMSANDSIFGNLSGEINVIVFALGGMTDGTGGADHMACDYVNGQNIEVCASFGSSMRCSALLEAEVSECSMNGNLCGLSTGEALSRWCAIVVGQDSLEDFASAPVWQQDGQPNFVDSTDSTDQNYDSTGCGMAFLSWIMKQGHTLAEVAQTMVQLGDPGTLAQLYNRLTGDNAQNAWPKFQGAVALVGTISTDDPFGALGAQAHHAAVCKVGSRRLKLRAK